MNATVRAALSVVALTVGLASVAAAQQETVGGEYELRIERPRTRATAPRVMLRLAPRTDGSFDVLRVVLDGRGQELTGWHGTARLRGAALECTFPARRGLVGALEQEDASKWGARAAYRFSRDGATISGKFSLLGPDGKVRKTVVESGTRTRKEPPPEQQQDDDDGDDPRDVPPPVIYGEEIGDGLFVQCFRSLIFTRADDPTEDEARPAYDLAAVRDCMGEPPAPGVNGERWSSRSWPLVAYESGAPSGGSGTSTNLLFRLVINEQQGALFGEQELFSDWLTWDGVCGEVTPDVDTGTGPGGYTTSVEVQGLPGDWRGGEFYVSRLDAHGPGQSTIEKFPDFAEVLPRRSGLLSAPVIQIDFGGDPAPEVSAAGCSLYGTVCPKTNVWQFTAVAIHPLTGENGPAGYKLEWTGVPGYRVVATTADGQPLTIEVELPPGRHTPTLTVSGPDPYTGQGAGVLGSASIHSIAVEEKPTWTVEPKDADAPEPVGAPFQLTNDLGGAKLPVDARLGVRGAGGAGSLAIRGRVSLDGYPQNEYWVTANDVADLPQVVSVPAGVAQTYYLQGYQLASTREGDLTLEVAGQAQLETCDDTGLYFYDPTACGQLPPVPYPVTIEWQPTDQEPFSSVYPIAYAVDEEELKYQEQEESRDRLEVFADQVASDYRGRGPDHGHEASNGYMGRINFVATIDWAPADVHVDYYTSDQLTIRWHVSANRANQHCREPGLLDLNAGQPLPERDGDLDARAVGLVSRVQLDFTSTLPGDAGPKAKAGERFWLVPHGAVAHSDLGERFWKRREVLVVPGEKVFHITLPSHPTAAQLQEIASFDPGAIFWMTRAQMASSPYASWRWTSPIDPGEDAVLQVFCFDGMGNVIPAGRPISWALDGGGFLGAYDPSHDPRPQETRSQEAEGVTLSNGEARIRFRQDRYPHCSWQIVDRPDASIVYLTIDGTTEIANYSALTTDRALPAPGPELVVYANYLGTSDRLDIARGDSAVIEATVLYRTSAGTEPVADVTVSFTSTNGRLVDGGDGHGRVPTDERGRARVLLTSTDARLTHDDYGEIIVTAAVQNKRSSVRTDPPPNVTVTHRPRWVSSAPATLRLEHPVLVWDAPADGTVDVETLPGRGDVADDVLRVPYRVRTKAVLQGAPNHTFRVAINKRAPSTSAPPRARYPFDVIASDGTTPSVPASPAALVAGARLAQQRQEGTHSLRFDGADQVTIPSDPAVDSRGGLRVGLWVRRTGNTPAVLLERTGQYRLELEANGKLRLLAGNGTPPAGVESDTPLPNGTWSYVEARISEAQLKLSWGDHPGVLTARAGPGPGSFPPSSASVTVGVQLRGNLDDLSFEKGFEDATHLADGVVISGGASGAVGTATVTTDANGRAEFWVSAVGPADPNDYRPVVIEVEVFGSPEARARALAVRRDIYGDMYAIGYAFLYGEESLPGGHASLFDDPQPEDVAAWLSNMVPLLSNIRDLVLEVQKAATGCDSVSWLNVTFALAGLAVDVVTFGAGSVVLGPIKGLLKGTVRPLLKLVVKSVAPDLALRGALEAFSRLITVEVMTAEGAQREPAPWVTDTIEYLTALKAWVEDQDLVGVVSDTFRSADELFLGLDLFRELGPAGFRDILVGAKEAEEVGIVLHLRGAPAVIGGGGPELLGGVGARLATLGVGPYDPVRRMFKRSKVTRGTIRALKGYVQSLGLANDPSARRGLIRLCGMVTHRPRLGDDAVLFTDRLVLALRQLPDDAARRLLLREFDATFTRITALPPADRDVLMQKLGEVCDTFASRFRHLGGTPTSGQLRGYRSRVRGACYHLQDIHDEVLNGRLRKIEPPAPRSDDLNMYRDALVLYAGGEAFKELKNVARHSGRALELQTGSHFERELRNFTSIPQMQAQLKPLVWQSIRPFSKIHADRVRDEATKAIIARSPALRSHRAAVRLWAQQNIHFLPPVPSRYGL